MLKLKRVVAIMIDFYIINSLWFILSIAICKDFESMFDNFYILILILFLMFVCKDIVFKNESIGKKIMRVKILMENEAIPNALTILLRNIFIIIWPVELILVFIKNKRIGDLIFKTNVVSVNKKSSIKKKEDNNEKKDKILINRKNDIDSNVVNSNLKNSNFFVSLLFILSISSILLSIKTLEMFLKINHIPTVLFFEYSWIMMFWIPLPILSIFLARKYFEKVKIGIINIVVSSVIALLLLVFSSFSYIFKFNSNYNNIYVYKDILQLNIPNEGDFYSIVVKSSQETQQTVNYARFNNVEEANMFYEEMQTKEIWISKKSISQNLNKFASNLPVCENKSEKCYYMVYVEETNSYNKIPSNLNEYSMYVFMYDHNTYTLTIHDYKYNNKY